MTLTASPASNSVITSWTGGGCAGSGTTCTVTMDQSRTVTVTFDLKPELSVTVSGTGTVTGTGGFSCATADLQPCTKFYDPGALVTLTADPGLGTITWSGDCSGTATGTTLNCDLTMNGDHSATATFT